MRKLTGHDVIGELAKALHKPVMYIAFGDEPFPELLQACPFLTMDDIQILMDGFAYLIFDTQEAMENAYNHVVGDDGPTKFNKYDGPARVYALTCDSNGRFLTENT